MYTNHPKRIYIHPDHILGGIPFMDSVPQSILPQRHYPCLKGHAKPRIHVIGTPKARIETTYFA
jgi:hypothetical protein